MLTLRNFEFFFVRNNYLIICSVICCVVSAAEGARYYKYLVINLIFWRTYSTLLIVVTERLHPLPLKYSSKTSTSSPTKKVGIFEYVILSAATFTNILVADRFL